MQLRFKKVHKLLQINKGEEGVMKRKMSIIVICLVLILSACNSKEEPTIESTDHPKVSNKVNQTTIPTETPQVSEKINQTTVPTESPQVSDNPVTNTSTNEKEEAVSGGSKYVYDVISDVPIQQQDERFYDMYTVYDAYKLYEYTDKNNSSIEEVALELGKVLMEDMKTDYDGKMFTITEYKDLTAKIDKDESRLSPLKENQWYCHYEALYKYSGVYGVVGPMPKEEEWANGLGSDGDVDYYFVIEKISDTEYAMRASRKTKRYVIEIQ